MELKIEQIAEMLKSLVNKQQQLDKIIELLGGEMNHSLLLDEIHTVEKWLVQAFGGDEGNYEYLDSADYFHQYRFGEITEEELLSEIKTAVDNGYSGEIPIIIHRS